MGTFVQTLSSEIICHINLKLRNLEVGERSSFFNYSFFMLEIFKNLICLIAITNLHLLSYKFPTNKIITVC